MVNKKIKKNKKAMATVAVIGIVISLLSMYLISDFIFSTSELTSTTAQDQACQASILAKDSTLGGIATFFTSIQSSCKTEDYEIENSNSEDQFKQIATSMAKCWNRYGNGEYDFLSSFGTEGNWCFSCAKLSFEEKGPVYNYANDFVPYTQQTEFTLSNGTKLTYYNYLNLRYFDENNSGLVDIQSGINEINNLITDEDSAMKTLIFSLSEKNQELLDLASKQIDTNEEIFVIYRYDTIPQSTLEIIGTTAASMGAGFGAGLAIESILFMGAGALLAIPTGGASLLVAGAALSKRAYTAVEKYSHLQEVYLKIEKIYDLTGKAIKFSKPQKLINFYHKYDDTIHGLHDLATNVGKISNEIGVRIKHLHSSLDKLGIKNIDDLNEEIFNQEDKLKNLQEVTDKMIDNGVLTKDKDLDLLVQTESGYIEKIDELNKLRDELIKTRDLSQLATSAQKKSHLENMRKYTKTLTGLGTALISGKVASEYNSENIQYVDLLNKEQYYRLCGTEPIFN